MLYAQDAMSGLDLANKIVDPQASIALFAQLFEKQGSLGAETFIEPEKKPVNYTRSPQVGILEATPKPTDLKRHVQRHVPLTQIWKYINPLMLYTRHLGIRGKTASPSSTS